jgi:zinc transporter 2
MRTQEKIKDLTETLIPKEDIISQSLNISQDDHLKSQEEAMKKLTLVCVICLIFMTIEIIGGYLANSIAIMSDAAHLLSDFLGFVISILSIYISRRVATTEMSYGFHRAEIIGALVSITLIWGLTIWLLYEATLRIIETPPVDGFIMVLVSIIGFAFNVIMGLVLAYQGIGHVHLHSHDHNHNHNHNHNHHNHDHHNHHEEEKKDENKEEKKDEHQEEKKDEHKDDKQDSNNKDNNNNNDNNSNNQSHSHSHSQNHSHNNHNHNTENVNLRAALIHVIGDALQNVGVIIAGIIIYFYPKLSIADPICTYIFSIIVGFTTIKILKDCISVLMEGSPFDFDFNRLESDLKGIEGVIDIHDLHVWSLSLGKVSLSCHISSNLPDETLPIAKKIIEKKYHIKHSTIQVEGVGKGIDCKHDLHQ